MARSGVFDMKNILSCLFMFTTLGRLESHMCKKADVKQFVAMTSNDRTAELSQSIERQSTFFVLHQVCSLRVIKL